jgi:threonine dehydratase
MTGRLSLDRIEAARRSIDPIFLDSPQFLSEPLGVILKIETVNPIRSFKGRGAHFFLSTLPSGTRHIVTASAGNFGQAMAHAARSRGFRATIFAAVSANPYKIDRMRELGAEVRLAGDDFDAAKVHAAAFAAESGAMFVEDGREVAISEGAGTIALELCRFATPIDVVISPLGNGALLAGLGTYFKARSPSTRVIGVCATGAPCMALSWRAGRPEPTTSMSTIADGIGVRVPVSEALDDLRPLLDDIVLVDDATMIDAMRLIFRHHGLVTEPAGVAGLAAVLAYGDRFRGATIATPICGGNLNPASLDLLRP